MAKKNNLSASDIDLTTFAWINAGEDPDNGKPGCGGCHPGGGGLEFDRDGQRYDLRAADEPSLSSSLDGDYHQSRWAETGVIEADCFICHLPGYNYKARLRQLSQKNFQWAVIPASGIGRVTGSVKENIKPQITYNKRLFNDDGQIVLDLMSEPSSENCLFCHGKADLLKRGFSWNDKQNHDVHNMHGIDCVRCHNGGPDHNLTKGDENLSTVRDDLDNTMLKCRECHAKGYNGAPLPLHRKIRPNHLEKLSCKVCHIPSLNRAAAQGLCVSSGKVITYPKQGAKTLGEQKTWRPDYHKGKDGRLEPVNHFRANLYTNLEQDGIHYPLFAREIKAAYTRLDDIDEVQVGLEPLVATPAQIQAMLELLEETLKQNRRFYQIRPAYHYLGRRYFLSENGNLTSEPDHTWVGEEAGFNISHNVAPTRTALGAKGCGDCHKRSSHIFECWIEGNSGAPGGEPPNPIKAGLRLDSINVYLKKLHQHNYLKWSIGPLAFLCVFFFAVRRSIEPMMAIFRSMAGMTALADLMAPLRKGALFLLAFTGYLFFYNNIELIDILFKNMAIAVRIHIAAGIVFALCSLPEIGRNNLKSIRLELMLVSMLSLTGVLNFCQKQFCFELKYAISVVHVSSAFVYVSLRAAHWYQATIAVKMRQQKKSRPV